MPLSDEQQLELSFVDIKLLHGVISVFILDFSVDAADSTRLNLKSAFPPTHLRPRRVFEEQAAGGFPTGANGAWRGRRSESGASDPPSLHFRAVFTPDNS